jgi:CHASE1-domain containing sensor protein
MPAVAELRLVLSMFSFGCVYTITRREARTSLSESAATAANMLQMQSVVMEEVNGMRVLHKFLLSWRALRVPR